MDSIKLNNGNSYQLMVNGAVDSDTTLILQIISTMSVDEAQEIFEDAENTTEINLYDSANTKMRTPWTGYTNLKSIKLTKDVVISEGETDTTGNVLEITLTQPVVKYATQESVDELTDAVLEMSSAVYGDGEEE